MAWLVSAGHRDGAPGSPGGEDPPAGAASIPTGVGRGHAWLKSCPQTPPASPAAHQEAWHFAMSAALISHTSPHTPPPPPPALVHIYIRCIQIYTESSGRYGHHKARPAAPSPLGAKAVGGTSPLSPGAGGRQGLQTPGSRHHFFHKAFESERRRAGTFSNIAPSSGFPRRAGIRQTGCWQACELEGSARRKPPAPPAGLCQTITTAKGEPGPARG